MYLTCDITSYVNKKKVYGKAGDKVKVLGYNGSVVIVEIEEKNGFAVKAEELSLTKKV